MSWIPAAINILASAICQSQVILIQSAVSQQSAPATVTDRTAGGGRGALPSD